MGTVEKVALILLAAATGEGINEFFFMPFLDRYEGRIDDILRQQLARLWSGFVGIGIAYELSLDIFGLLDAQVRHPVVTFILTGLLIGRGSNWLHDLIKKFISVQPALDAIPR